MIMFHRYDKTVSKSYRIVRLYIVRIAAHCHVLITSLGARLRLMDANVTRRCMKPTAVDVSAVVGPMESHT